MSVKITKHFNYSTPFDEAENDDELEKIMRLKYPKACNNLERDAGFFARMVEEVKQFSAWRVIGFKSFEDFCREELGKTLEEVEQIMRGVRILQAQGVTEPTLAQVMDTVPDLAESRRPTKEEQGNKDSNGILIKGGNNRNYLAARLKRDHPGIVERVKAGEFKSMRAAAIEAGIVKIKSPLEQLIHWWKKASAAERETFKTWAE
jgi:hypothetical protein